MCRDCGLACRVDVQQCYRCGVVTIGGRTCENCAPLVRLTGVVVPGRYTGVLREAVLGLKFHRQQAVVDVLATWLMEVVRSEQFDFVTSVPISPARYRERGYNQSELLARALVRRTGLRYRAVLGREGATHQLGAGRADRFRQVEGKFYSTKRLHGERLLVVDDVITTGATLEACAAELLAAGAGEVWGAAVARD